MQNSSLHIKNKRYFHTKSMYFDCLNVVYKMLRKSLIFVSDYFTYGKYPYRLSLILVNSLVYIVVKSLPQRNIVETKTFCNWNDLSLFMITKNVF